MKIVDRKLDGVLLLEPVLHGDDRGYFFEATRESFWTDHLQGRRFVQDSESFNMKEGIIRGLHFQRNPRAQAQLVRVVSGAIFDVAVDLRRASPTFGQWTSAILSEHNKRQFFLPRGFAHGFCTLTERVKILYKADDYFSPEHDGGLLWSDGRLGIPWPASNPSVSQKDANLPLLQDIAAGDLF